MPQETMQQLRDAWMFNMDRWHVAEMTQLPVDVIHDHFNRWDAAQRN